MDKTTKLQLLADVMRGLDMLPSPHFPSVGDTAQYVAAYRNVTSRLMSLYKEIEGEEVTNGEQNS